MRKSHNHNKSHKSHSTTAEMSEQQRGLKRANTPPASALLIGQCSWGELIRTGAAHRMDGLQSVPLVLLRWCATTSHNDFRRHRNRS
jgi:hypothetical protein